MLPVPSSLEATISALAVTSTKNQLEAINLPADWLDSSLTTRQILRRIGKFMLFDQRHWGLHGEALLQGITLDTRWNQLSNAQQTKLRATADSLGIDYSAVTSTMTLRQILVLLGDQLPVFSLRGNDF